MLVCIYLVLIAADICNIMPNPQMWQQVIQADRMGKARGKLLSCGEASA